MKTKDPLYAVITGLAIGILLILLSASGGTYAQDATPEPTLVPEPTSTPVNMGIESGIDVVICEVDMEEFETFIYLASSHLECDYQTEFAAITIDWVNETVGWNETVLVDRSLFEFTRPSTGP